MDYIPFNYYTISLLLGGFTALISGIVVLAHDRHRAENQAWFALTMATAVWSFAYFFMTISQTHDFGLLSNWILHYAAIFIPLFYYLLVLVITSRLDKNKFIFGLFTFFALCFTVINTSPLFIADVGPKVGFNFGPIPGPFYVFFFIYYCVVITVGLTTTARAIFDSKDKVTRTRFLYTIIFTVAASVGGGSVFLTTFFATIPPYLLILFSLYPAISGYAILKYQLFDVKVIITQIFIYIIWIFILIRILLSESIREQIANSALLFVTIVMGLILTRSVKKEVQQREKIERLATDLAKANENQVALIHFITHQVKGFFTKSRDIFSMLLEGDAGDIPEAAKKFARQGFESDTKGVAMVQDVLTASNVKSGVVKYTMEPFDLQTLVSALAIEYKSMAEGKGLKLTYEAQAGVSYRVAGDQEQLKNVFKNLIENSIKYTPSGSVAINLFVKGQTTPDMLDDVAVFSIKDTGVGITPEDKRLLFTQGGRGKDSVKVNVESTGYGLYIAKGIVEAHHGVIRAASEGPGKGSQFYVELPRVG